MLRLLAKGGFQVTISGRQKHLMRMHIMKRTTFVLLVLITFFCFYHPQYADGAEQGKIEFRDGTIVFPEKTIPEVNLTKLKFSIPDNCPPEILNLKGKIFRGELVSGRNPNNKQITYFILLSFNPDIKEMTLYFVLDRGYEGKPTKSIRSGLYDPENGSVLKSGNTEHMTQEYRLTFLKNGQPRIRTSQGRDGDFNIVAEFPTPIN